MPRVPLPGPRAWRRLGYAVLRYSAVAVVLLSADCWRNYWGRRPLDQPTPVGRDNPVWIWSGGAVHRWHAVVITQDSVSGIPFGVSVKCDSCRRSIPRTQVDSMKLGYRTVAEDVTDFVTLLTAGLVADAAVCSVLLPHDRQC